MTLGVSVRFAARVRVVGQRKCAPLPSQAVFELCHAMKSVWRDHSGRAGNANDDLAFGELEDLPNLALQANPRFLSL